MGMGWMGSWGGVGEKILEGNGMGWVWRWGGNLGYRGMEEELRGAGGY